MDLSFRWRAQHTRQLLFLSEIHIPEPLLGFLGPEYECSKCWQILNREKFIHQKNDPTYDARVGRHEVNKQFRKGILADHNLCLKLIFFIHHWWKHKISCF